MFITELTHANYPTDIAVEKVRNINPTNKKIVDRLFTEAILESHYTG
jgi:hypothetical protein